MVDLPTGEIRQAHIFVAVLGASSYTYAEAHLAEDLPNWIGGHVRSLAFFGGVPEIIVPDNTTTGVKHPSRYEPDLNPTYLDMAEHYRTVVIPARVGKPKDKAKVEVGVQVVEPRVRVPGERWILACLRDRTFFGLVDLNRSIHELLEDLNNRVMRHLGQSRRELFEALDRPALKPLPAAAYEFAVWKKARVNIDYHVEFDHHYYSVPYRLIKQEVFLRVSENTLEIFHKHQRVASHPRSRVPGRYSTLLDHMPPAHRHYGEWSPERFLKWAEQIGPQTRRLIETILGSRIPPQQGYRSCLGILSLAKRHTQERLEAACARALPANIHTYKGVKNILEAHLDQLPLEETVSIPLKTHANIRGSSYASGRVAGYYR